MRLPTFFSSLFIYTNEIYISFGRVACASQVASHNRRNIQYIRLRVHLSPIDFDWHQHSALSRPFSVIIYKISQILCNIRGMSRKCRMVQQPPGCAHSADRKKKMANQRAFQWPISTTNNDEDVYPLSLRSICNSGIRRASPAPHSVVTRHDARRRMQAKQSAEWENELSERMVFRRQNPQVECDISRREHFADNFASAAILCSRIQLNWWKRKLYHCVTWHSHFSVEDIWIFFVGLRSNRVQSRRVWFYSVFTSSVVE